jgi:hypothetical protein
MNALFKNPQSATTFRADWAYADWLAHELAVVNSLAPACWSEHRKQEAAITNVRAHAPLDLIRAHFAAKKAARDAEYGKAPFRLTLYGLEKL